MSESEIMVLKMATGEQLIAKGTVIEDDEGNIAGYNLHKPRVMIFNRNQQGQVVASLMPWMVDETEIYSYGIIGRALIVPKELEDYYIQQTTNIQVANQMPPAPPMPAPEPFKGQPGPPGTKKKKLN